MAKSVRGSGNMSKLQESKIFFVITDELRPQGPFTTSELNEFISAKENEGHDVEECYVIDCLSIKVKNVKIERSVKLI